MFENNTRDENDDSAYGPLPVIIVIFTACVLSAIATILVIGVFR